MITVVRRSSEDLVRRGMKWAIIIALSNPYQKREFTNADQHHDHPSLVWQSHPIVRTSAGESSQNRLADNLAASKIALGESCKLAPQGSGILELNQNQISNPRAQPYYSNTALTPWRLAPPLERLRIHRLNFSTAHENKKKVKPTRELCRLTARVFQKLSSVLLLTRRYRRQILSRIIKHTSALRRGWKRRG